MSGAIGKIVNLLNLDSATIGKVSVTTTSEILDCCNFSAALPDKIP